MRSTTKSILTVVSIGLVAASYKFGIETAAAETNSLVSLGGNTANSTGDGTSLSTDITAGGSTAVSNGSNAAGSTSTSGSSANSGSGASTSSSTSGTTTTTKKATTTKKTSTSTSASGSTSSPSPSTTTAAPQPTTPAVPPVTPPVSTTVTKTGGAIHYWYGDFQVSVTKTSGTITAVNVLQGTYTRAPQGTITWLTQSAVASQGSGFGNITRATYTTNAFKQALDSALAKF